MASEKVELGITAKDDASKVLDQVAKKGEALEKLDPKIEIDAKDKASDKLDDVAKAAKGIADKPYDIDLRLNDKGDIKGDLARIKGEIEETARAASDLGQKTVTFRVDASDFEKVKPELQGIETQIKEIDAKTIDITVKTEDLDTVGQRLRNVDKNIKDVNKSAGSSKSALANMVGNSAQDLGNLAGVAGSAGVAVGQMAEYFADARFEGEGFRSVMKSFAGVALPILAISGAIALISGVMEQMGLDAKQATEDAKAFTEALQGNNKAIDDQVLALAKSKLDEQSENMAAFGLSLDGVKGAITGTNEEFLKFYNAIGSGMDLTGDAAKENTQLRLSIGQLREAYITAAASTTNMFLASEKNGAAQLQQAAATKLTKDQQAELNVILADGVVTEDEVRNATFDLTTVLGEAADAMGRLTEAGKAQNTQWDAYVDGAEAAYKATFDTARNLKELQTGLRSLTSPLKATASAADGFGKAFSDQREQLFGIHKTYGEVETGIGGLVKQLKEAPQAFKDTNSHITSFSETGRDVLGTLEGLNGKLGSNFDAIIKSGGSYDDIRGKAAGYREELGAQFDQLGITKDEQEAYLTQLGLTPEQIETTIKLSQQAEAESQLANYQALIDKLPPEILTEYLALVKQEDFVGAQALLNGLVYDPKTNTWRHAAYTTSADTSDATVTLQKVTDGTYQATVDVDGNPVEVHATLQQIHDGGYDTTVTVNGEPHPARVAIKQVEDGSYTATITVQAVGLQGIMDRFQSLTSKTITVTTLHEDGTHGTMAGGPRGPGYYTINEAGQEVVFLPGGSEVMTAGQVMTAGGLGGGTTIINNHFNVSVPLGASKAAVGAQIADALDAFYRTSGNRTRLRSV